MPASASFANVAINSTTGEVTITAEPQESGVQTFTIIADDGQTKNNTASQTFTLVVNAINDAPTLGAIADQTTDEATATGSIGFTVGDVETSAGALSVSVTSSNQTLVPNGNIVLGGSSANRTLRITPASGQNGSATITVIASDGSLSVQDTFVLNVTGSTLVPRVYIPLAM